VDAEDAKIGYLQDSWTNQPIPTADQNDIWSIGPDHLVGGDLRRCYQKVEVVLLCEICKVF